MDLKSLLSVLLEFLGPLLRALLEGLLSRAAERIEARGTVVNSSYVAIESLFEEARRLTWWRRGLLRACERVAITNAPKLAAAAWGEGEQPKMSEADQKAVANHL